MDWFVGIIQWLYESIRDLIVGVISWLWNGIKSITTYIVDALHAFWDALESMLSNWLAFAVDYLGSVLDGLWTVMLDTGVWVWGWLMFYGGQFTEWLFAELERLGVTVSLDDIKAGFGTLADVYGDAAWLLPLNEVMAIVASTLVLMATIRAVRWIVSALWVTG